MTHTFSTQFLIILDSNYETKVKFVSPKNKVMSYEVKFLNYHIIMSKMSFNINAFIYLV